MDQFPWNDEDRFGSARAEVIQPTIELESAEARANSSLESVSGNRAVNPSTNFDVIKSEYETLLKEAVIRPERLGSATQKWSVLWYAATIGLNKARYDPISAATDVPWFVIGIIHGLECSFDFSRHLFNGDPLDDYTKRYPAGYPRDRGAPPFSFAASAISALRYDHLDGHQDWTLARTLHRLEQYNGLSYRTKLKMASPYLWSFTTLYDIGKFKEIPRPGGGYQSVYDPNLRSKQCGAGTMLKALLDARTLPAMA